MSAPSPGAPAQAAYSIDTDKQCGIVKPNGNRCTARLSCRIHSVAEKKKVEQSGTYNKMLQKQPDSLALDVYPTAVPTAAGSRPELAPIFDPDIHCGVELSAGPPCTQPLLVCISHLYEQQLLVRGRCAGLDDIRRVHQANTDATSQGGKNSNGTTFNPDIHCGATPRDGSCCLASLSCSNHARKARRAVPRNAPFHYLDDLLRLQLASKKVVELNERAHYLNPDVCCSVTTDVWDNGSQRCANALNCFTHSDQQKLAVQRSAELPTHFEAQSSTSAVRDPQCYVTLPNGGVCPNGLDCGFHTIAEKNTIPRRAGVRQLLTLRETSNYAGMSFGLSSVLSEEDQQPDTRVESAIQLYRRTGMQSLSVNNVIEYGDCFQYPVNDISSKNLNRLRQLLFEPVPQAPTRSVDQLDRTKCRTLGAENATCFYAGSEFCFAFAKTPSVLKSTY